MRGSDRTIRHGHISKQGSTWLRWILAEAAQTAKRSPQFAASYQAIARRRGKKIATTAIARKLLTRAYHLLTDADNAAAAHTTADTARSNTGTPQPDRARYQTGRITTPRASSQSRISRPRRARLPD